MAREEGELGAALFARVRESIARARRTVAHADVLRSASRLRRDADTMAKHCAWCGRVFLAGTWMEVEHTPQFVASALVERATHTICEDCVRGLEDSGQSVRG